MDFFTADFWSALLAIVIIDLVLAGDNAIVIGLSARNLPKDQQKKVIFWGTFGAIAIRSLLTLAVVWLLKIPGLLLLGGAMLIWIAYKLLVEEKKHDVASAASIWAAIKTIIIADTVMGLDNVLAVAGAAHGDFILVVMGLLVSVPIVVWGSTLILKWVERFPVIIYIGSGVLAWTAGKMITDEPLVKGFFTESPVLKWGLIIVIIAGVLFMGRLKKQKEVKQAA
ncbi:TerC family protein [Paenibacillus melissococcoides]|uniref:TerC family protein n=1 Tax=Paenibacillus melissococcoides TaxID=2912268 RepID=A0ABM9G009_9BACL|nr:MULTISPECIES: TerC family protein [Paenibacillus]MEB9892614.1 TerC family protein [Bacillus cereus]CAH8244850.1 TerC family protein [Paenibacillus melissococcoides]CAH8709162.1 TerC family protein [Paenibacillus melissococcoides]CAH8709918.1 TerC family protein [Paenibacillus melissococcoides]GIO82387.1 membrane protein [Paenibacillus dendritiformis]